MAATRKLLEETKVSSLEACKSVIELKSTDSTYDAFQTLISNNILSAPVHDGKEYIGFLDIRDLVSFVVFIHDEQKVTDNATLKDILVHGGGIVKTATTDGVTVSYLARRNRYHPVKESDNLLEVTKILAQRVHRVPVVNASGKIINIISQSTICAFIAKNIKPEPVFEKKISEVAIGTSPVLSVKKDATVIQTFKLMDSVKRSGVAIVDKLGRLVGTTTGKDLALFLRQPSLAALDANIFQYLQTIRRESIDIKAPTISVFDHDKIPLAIGKIAATRVHRVFVVDDEKGFKPIKVISVCDILKFILEAN